MKLYKTQADEMLAAFSFSPCEIDDETMLLLDGLSIMCEERNYIYETIAGKRTELRDFFVLYVSTVEYNYPNEPDSIDIAEVSAHLSLLDAIAAALRLHLENQIDQFFEYRELALFRRTLF